MNTKKKKWNLKFIIRITEWENPKNGKTSNVAKKLQISIYKLNFRAEESDAEKEERRKKSRENYVPVSELKTEEEKEARRKYEREKKRLQRMKKKESQTSDQA